MKDKKGIAITIFFQKMLDGSSCKKNKIWVDKGSEFYNPSMKLGLQDNDIEMCSTHGEGKSVVAERFFRIWKNKIHNTWLQYHKMYVLIN